MKKNDVNLILFCLWCLFLMWMCSSCGSQKLPTQIPVHTKEKVVERLVPYALPPDSSAIEALFECDSLNNVRLNEISELKTKGLQSKFSFNNGMFKYNLNTVHDTIYIPAKDSIIERDVPIYINVPGDTVYKQTDAQIIFSWVGRIVSVILGIGLIYSILRWKLKR